MTAEISTFFADCSAIDSESGRCCPSRDSVRVSACTVTTGGSAACATISMPNGGNPKEFYKTMAYEEVSITAACYLFNTHSQTACGSPS